MRALLVKHILILVCAEALLGIFYRYYKPDCCFPVADCTSLEQDLVLELLIFLLPVALLYLVVDILFYRRNRNA